MMNRFFHRRAPTIRDRTPWRVAVRCVATVAALSALSGGRLSAQANLSTQGFGYPTGQFSTRSQGTGGAIAEMDALSPVNPAAISSFSTRLLFFQIEPEYRTVTTAAGTERTSIARYPNVFGALPLSHNFVVSFGASTFLDRTSTTTINTTQTLIDGQTVDMSTTYRIDGAMDDIRLAGGWAPAPWLRVGLGAHEITGHNRVEVNQSFADSVQFAPFTQSRILGFNGPAASAGVELMSKWVVGAASLRRGGTLRMSAEDTVLSSARVPNHYGASIAFTRIPNSSIAVRVARDDWSSLGSLGSNGLVGVDAWDTSVGADIAGPRFGDRVFSLRGGFRHRTLPFEAAGNEVTETSFSGGIGSAFANGRVLGDVAAVHANRTAGSLDARERAWTISLGLSVQP